MRKSTIAMIAALMLMPMLAEARLAHLTVTVHGLDPATGTVEVSLFNSAESFMKKPLVQKSSPVDGQAELTFEIPAMLEGDYAVVVVHDENGNGLLDTGFFGFGGESYGFSNNASHWLGRPSFEETRFTMGTEDQEIVIDLD